MAVARSLPALLLPILVLVLASLAAAAACTQARIQLAEPHKDDVFTHSFPAAHVTLMFPEGIDDSQKDGIVEGVDVVWQDVATGEVLSREPFLDEVFSLRDAAPAPDATRSIDRTFRLTATDACGTTYQDIRLRFTVFTCLDDFVCSVLEDGPAVGEVQEGMPPA
eukprot:CAMPEP_0177640734 /NCGR_PEP_ID=MMETSP0447-20121125/6697_1 /TAXON_ID=0 /ORGANISM="Stygamoeba regulata, Strain BSH-02190019" /LENGTH=164 /DNA_ID=CAMNT_0019142817 /DNA_START=183 /DNA_END=673 /DNA_ORIENTATION=+